MLCYPFGPAPRRWSGRALRMGWETRERGGLYYTRSKKVDGRVVREYVGGGLLGELVAQTDAEERQRREEEAARWRTEREALEALDAPVDELSEAAELLARDALVARHLRGRRGAPRLRG